MALGRGVGSKIPLALLLESASRTPGGRPFKQFKHGVEYTTNGAPDLGLGRSENGRDEGATVATRGLPSHLQLQILSLLRRLLRSGRQLARTPPLLQEEFVLLASVVVRCAAAAAATGQGGAGKPGEAAPGKGRSTSKRNREGDGAVNDVSCADIVSTSVGLLEDIQRGGCDKTASLNDESGDERRLDEGLRLTLDEALALSCAATIPADLSSPLVGLRTGLKSRTVALLASPGAVVTEMNESTMSEGDVHVRRVLSAWVLTIAHDEVQAKDVGFSSRREGVESPQLATPSDVFVGGNEVMAKRDAATAAAGRSAADVALRALVFVNALSTKRLSSLDAVGDIDGTVSNAFASSWSALDLAAGASRLSSPLRESGKSAAWNGPNDSGCAALWRVAVTYVLAKLELVEKSMTVRSTPATETDTDLVTLAESSDLVRKLNPLLAALAGVLRSSELLNESVGGGSDVGAAGYMYDTVSSARECTQAARDWAASTAGLILAAALFSALPVARTCTAAAATPSVAWRSKGKDEVLNGRHRSQHRDDGSTFSEGSRARKQSASSEVIVHVDGDDSVKRGASVCRQLLEATVPTFLEGGGVIEKFIAEVRGSLHETAGGTSAAPYLQEEPVTAEGIGQAIGVSGGVRSAQSSRKRRSTKRRRSSGGA